VLEKLLVSNQQRTRIVHMPRRKRFDLPGVPLHLVQRGIDRRACFFSEDDYCAYLGWLAEASRHYRCDVHAYVLMTNHVHLLLTPRASRAVAGMMQYLGRYYVRYINRRYGRTGSLWEGRYKASLVDGEHYLLTCHCYIELNPVRAGMVIDPGSYRWSSYRGNAQGVCDTLLVHHDSYLALGLGSADRRRNYRELFRTELNDTILLEIRSAVNHCHVLGSQHFQSQVEAILGRKLGTGRPGRPRTPQRVKGPDRDQLELLTKEY
jgi:putative transposase